MQAHIGGFPVLTIHRHSPHPQVTILESLLLGRVSFCNGSFGQLESQIQTFLAQSSDKGTIKALSRPTVLSGNDEYHSHLPFPELLRSACLLQDPLMFLFPLRQRAQVQLLKIPQPLSSSRFSHPPSETLQETHSSGEGISTDPGNDFLSSSCQESTGQTSPSAKCQSCLPEPVWACLVC